MKINKLLFLLGFIFLVTVPVYANKMINVDEKVQKMKTDFNLTQEQADKIRPIIQEYKDKMETIRQEKEDKLSQILSADQMKQFKTMKKDKYSEEKE